MARNPAAIVLLFGGGALLYWLATRLDEGVGGVYAPLDFTPPATIPPAIASGDYLARLSRAEDPSGDPYAKNPFSSASGLYQFTKSTWTRLGGQWGDDPTKAFGGLYPSPELQHAMAAKLTAANASLLQDAGQAVNNLTLYAVHVFGPAALSILRAPTAARLDSYVSRSTVAKNPALGQTVASFFDYLTRKVG